MNDNFLTALALSACQDFPSAYRLYQEKNSPILSYADFKQKILSYRQNQEDLIFTSKPEDNLLALRRCLLSNQLDGFIFSTSDEYGNEYVALRAKRFKYLTGFDPSLGLCIVLAHQAAIFVDGRYKTQAINEVQQNLYNIENYTLNAIALWLKNNTANITATNYKIGVNIKTTSLAQLQFYQKICQENNISLVLLNYHLVDNIWPQQPVTPISPVKIHPLQYCGQNSINKISALAKVLLNANIDNYLFTSLDSIAWLLNIRGNDIECNPLVLSKLVLTKEEKVFWFVDYNKISSELKRNLPTQVTFLAEEALEEFIITTPGNCWGIDQTSPAYYSILLTKEQKELVYLNDPAQTAKSIKNKIEITGMQQAHLTDGIAITKLLYQLYTNKNYQWDELSIASQLDNLRNHSKLYTKQPSFPCIVGVNENGAIIHYKANKKTNKKLDYNGYLLLDCGGQYYCGTTDVTRSLSFDTVSHDYKKNYTYVLKGHINLALSVFTKGTTGQQLDAIARYPLQTAGLDYSHATGHGVGCYLCVHESPPNISTASEAILQAGNIISNEPGFYKEGQYGIRLENLYVVSEYDTHSLQLNNLTLVPFACKNIDDTLLQPPEKTWLNNYHKDIINKLTPFLTNLELLWLQSYIVFF